MHFLLSGDGGVHITDCSTCQTIGTLRGHTGNVMAVYASEGDIIATGSTDNTLRLWDLRSHRCIDVVLVGDSCPASVALSHSGSYLASGNYIIISYSLLPKAIIIFFLYSQYFPVNVPLCFCNFAI